MRKVLCDNCGTEVISGPHDPRDCMGWTAEIMGPANNGIIFDFCSEECVRAKLASPFEFDQADHYNHSLTDRIAEAVKEGIEAVSKTA